MISLENLQFLQASRAVLNAQELAMLEDALRYVVAPVWMPLTESPQEMAFHSIADVIGYGGAAGGGKTDLILGKALLQHRRAAIFRVNGTEHEACIDRLEEILDTRDGFNSTKGIWRKAGPRRSQIEFLSIPNPNDHLKYRGRPHDLKAFDEVTEMLEFQVRFLMGWLRTTAIGQRCQAVLAFNPPTSSEGRWVIEYFGPWLDLKHPNPAKPGELRWFAMFNGKEKEVDDSRPFVLLGDNMVFDYDPEQYAATDVITPQSRTFIPARVSDNTYLGASYMNQLQALPEPLRSQLLYGDFQAGIEDSAFQLLPTDWVDAAMARWVDYAPKGEMMSLGIDVARGGIDNTIIARRHKHPSRQHGRANWFDKLLLYPGKTTRDGPTVCGLTIAATRNNAPQHIDVIGVGASPYDFLVENNQQVVGVNCSEVAMGTDRSGMLRFSNQRSEDGWRLREELDPANDTGIMLPPDKDLAKELTSIHWHIKGKTIQIESRVEIIDRLKRSADRYTAITLALRDTPKFSMAQEIGRRNNGNDQREYNPYKAMDYDPYASTAQ